MPQQVPEIADKIVSVQRSFHAQAIGDQRVSGLDTRAAVRPRVSLRRNFADTFLGNACYSGCQWGVLVVLAKIGTIEMVGRFALGLAITAPIFMLANLQLRGVQATDARDEYNFGDFLGLRLITTVIALLVNMTVVYLAGYHQEVTAVILAIGFGKAFEAIADIFLGLIQKHERMDRISKARVLHGLLSLGGLTVGIALTGNLFWGAVGWALGPLLTLVTYIHRAAFDTIRAHGQSRFRKFEVLKPHWQLGVLASLAWLALPLGAVMMLISLTTTIPNYFIEGLLGERALGHFAAMASLIACGTMVVGALGQTTVPRLAKYYASANLRAYQRLLSRLLLVGLFCGMCGVLIATTMGQTLMTFLYTAEYAQRVDVLVWLMVAGTLRYLSSFLGYGMTAARYFRVQAPLFAGVTVVMLLACSLLIPAYGLLGAALATLIAALSQLCASAFVVFLVVPQGIRTSTS